MPIARPWTLALFALSLAACGGATTSNPPGPQPLEADAGPDDAASDATAPTTDAAPSIEEKDGDASDAAEGAAEFSCPGWVVPDETASCSQNTMNNQCSASCRSGSRYWQSQCQDGVCTCSLGIDVRCECEMPEGACQSCCPGMPR